MSEDKGPSVARALVNPVGLGVVAGAATVAVALTNPLVAAVGGGVYVASVLVDAIRRARKKKPRRNLGVMPDPDTLSDPDARTAVNRIIDARAAIQAVVDETPPDVVMQLTKTLATLDEMEGYAASLVRRAEDSTKYLSTVNLPALVNEVKTLATRAATAKDPSARASFDQAKDARMDEIRSLKELRANKERIYADLMRVVALMCALPTKIVRLRALDAQAMEQLSGDITQDLQSIGEELQTSERVLRDLVPASRKREKVPA
jgi:hypothetical protein